MLFFLSVTFVDGSAHQFTGTKSGIVAAVLLVIADPLLAVEVLLLAEPDGQGIQGDTDTVSTENVTEIVKKAQINRGTFYLHFNNADSQSQEFLKNVQFNLFLLFLDIAFHFINL